MVQYLKTRLYDVFRGTANGDVLIFKERSERRTARFLLVSDRAVRDDWTHITESTTLSTLPLCGSNAEALSLRLHGPFYYTNDVVSSCPEWMSLTSYCTMLDQNADHRIGVFGNNTVDPVSVLGFGEPFDPAQEIAVSELFAPAVSSSRTSGGPAVAHTSAESVAMLEGYTRTEIYSGFSGYHHNQRVHRFNTPIVADKPWRIGIELEVYARSQQAYNTITGARSNWFQCESDSSLNDARYPIELKTIPLRACDAKSVEFWDAPMRKLGSLAKSKEYHSTGLHVHIGKEVLGDNERERIETLNKLCWFYVYRVESDPDAHAKNVTMAGREHGYGGNLQDSKSEIADFAEMIGYKTVVANKSAFDKMAEGIREKTRSQRWDINLKHLNDYGTVEFRKGDGRISKTRIAGLVTWWEQMTLYCRNHSQDQLDFNEFFTGVCAEYPAVAYFFTQDEEV